MTDKANKEEKKEVKNIKIFGAGRLYNPDNEVYFVRFDGDGEALISKDEVQIVKKYHPQVRFVGQKEKPTTPTIKNYVQPKSMKDVKMGFKIPIKES